MYLCTYYSHDAICTHIYSTYIGVYLSICLQYFQVAAKSLYVAAVPNEASNIPYQTEYRYLLTAIYAHTLSWAPITCQATRPLKQVRGTSGHTSVNSVVKEFQDLSVEKLFVEIPLYILGKT